MERNKGFEHCWRDKTAPCEGIDDENMTSNGNKHGTIIIESLPIMFFPTLQIYGFNHFLCSPLLGEMIQLDEHIFQMGWFNRQLEMLCCL